MWNTVESISSNGDHRSLETEINQKLTFFDIVQILFFSVLKIMCRMYRYYIDGKTAYTFLCNCFEMNLFSRCHKMRSRHLKYINRRQRLYIKLLIGKTFSYKMVVGDSFCLFLCRKLLDFNWSKTVKHYFLVLIPNCVPS